jgi:hypothetical protein
MVYIHEHMISGGNRRVLLTYQGSRVMKGLGLRHHLSTALVQCCAIEMGYHPEEIIIINASN